MNYKETLLYMYNALPMFHRQGAVAYKKDLTNITALCRAMGNPHEHLKCFHIAGTNGKGSVTHLLAAILQANGFKTGVYVSPHYKDFRERIKINGEYISKSYITRFINNYRALFEEIKPSFFEMTVALAFKWFEKQKVDYAVIETGLGGRLDSTNIISPLLSIITNISWDHSDMLGDTLEKIATEKAGIIKKNTPVLIGRKQEVTQEVFYHTSRLNTAPLYYAEDLVLDFNYQHTDRGLDYIQYSILNSKRTVRPSLTGLYQWENIKTVLAASELINHKLNIPLSPDGIANGLSKTKELTKIIGRWQIISEDPMLICESAHNEDGIQFLIDQLKKMNYKNLHLVFGFVKEKPLDKILSKLPVNAIYYFVKAKIPRAMEPVELKSIANDYGLKGKTYTSVRKAVSAAKQKSQKNDLILVTGSIFVVAEVL